MVTLKLLVKNRGPGKKSTLVPGNIIGKIISILYSRDCSKQLRNLTNTHGALRAIQDGSPRNLEDAERLFFENQFNKKKKKQFTR